VLEPDETGDYEWVDTSGRTRRVVVRSAPAVLEVTGPWEIQFPAGSGAPASITVDRMVDWSRHADPGVKHFSGTAIYRRTLEIPRALLNCGTRLELDLGNVAIMAQVTVNGRDLGVLWKPPYCVDITAAARRGPNGLEVRVVNLWVNRMIGDEQLPEDSEINPDGTLKSWPPWLQRG
jgi:hypothetical protein